MILTIFLVAMVSIGWGVAFISLATLLKVLAPMQLLACRWTITAVLFLILIAAGRIRIRLRGRKNVPFLFLAGLFEPCAYSILEAYGVKMTSASTSAIFVATIPCMTLILGILLFRNKADWKLVASLIITFAGVVVATFFSPAFAMGGTRAGMLCMTAGVVAASMYSLSSKKASGDFDASTVTAVMAFEGAILFFEDIPEFCNEEYMAGFFDWLGSNGYLQVLSGVIIGKMRMEGSFRPYADRIREIVSGKYRCTALPVMGDLNFGHTSPACILPYGAEAEINVDELTFTILESGVI